MAKEKLKDLNEEALLSKRKGHIKRIRYTIIVLSVFSIYIVYLDFIKNTQYDYKITYIMIAAGCAAILGEALYKTRNIDSEIRKRKQSS